jgi:transcriptional regulator with XRE-family HTH domain
MGTLPSAQLPGLATDALSQGLDSPALRELAGTSLRDVRDARDFILVALSELGITLLDEQQVLWELVQSAPGAGRPGDLLEEGGDFLPGGSPLAAGRVRALNFPYTLKVEQHLSALTAIIVAGDDRMAAMPKIGRPARVHPYSSPARAGVRLLGAEIARERKQARVTAADLAERARISLVTLRKVERGEPSVAIGTVFEVAVLLGIDLLGTPEQVRDRTGRAHESLALLPQRVRHPAAGEVDDDF